MEYEILGKFETIQVSLVNDGTRASIRRANFLLPVKMHKWYTCICKLTANNDEHYIVRREVRSSLKSWPLVLHHARSRIHACTVEGTAVLTPLWQMCWPAWLTSTSDRSLLSSQYTDDNIAIAYVLEGYNKGFTIQFQKWNVFFFMHQFF